MFILQKMIERDMRLLSAPIIAGICVTLATVLIAYEEYKWPLYSSPFEISLIVVGLCLIIPYIFDIISKISATEEHLIKIQKSVDEKKLLEPMSEKLRPYHSFIRQIAEDTIKAQLESIVPRDRGFCISGTDWAMRANRNFWKVLQPLAYPQKHAGRPLVCYVMNSSDPRLWRGHESFESLKEQEKFIEYGGFIKRIIVGNASFDEIKKSIATSEYEDRTKYIRSMLGPYKFEGPPTAQDYADILILMSFFKITVYYQNVQTSESIYASDFACINLDDKEFVIRWVYAHRFGRVHECLFEQSETRDFEESWKRSEMMAESVAGLVNIPRENHLRGNQEV